MSRKSVVASRAVAVACVVCFCVSALAVDIVAPRDQPAVPEPLREYVPLVEKCARYQELTTRHGWETVFHERFDPGAKQTWSVDRGGDGPAEDIPVKLGKDEERDVLLFDCSAVGSGMLTIGPPVSGEFGVEFTGRITSENVCDLSIVMNSTSTGPGFLFGSWYNQKNVLLRGAAPGGWNGSRVDVPEPTPKAERNRWYTVRLEVRGGEVAGYVDGKLIGKTPLSNGHQMDAPQQAILYTFNSLLVIDELKVESYRRRKTDVDADDAWAQTFEGQTRDEVREKLDELVTMLADSEPASRRAASALLTRAGQLALPVLEDAVRSGSPEQVARAKRIWRTIGPAQITDGAATQPATP